METVLIWTLLYWNSPEMIGPDDDKYVVRSSTSYFRTEEECWKALPDTFKTFPTIRYSCTKTMITKAELDREDERTAKSKRDLERIAEEHRRKHAPISYGPYPKPKQ